MQCVLKIVATITFRKCHFYGHFLSIFVTMLKIQFRTNIILIRANKIFCPIKRVSLLNLLIEVVDGLVHSLDLGRKQSLK